MSHLMRTEIGEQPELLRRIAEEEWRAVQTVAQQIRDHDLNYVFLAARGTSDNAAAYFKYLFEIVNGVPCGLAAPSVVTLYRAHLNLRGALVVGISQSGEAPDVVEYLAHAKANGAFTLAITNEPASPLAQTSHFTLLLRAGIERSVAATKTYTGTLAIIYLLSEALSGHLDAPQHLHQAAAFVEQVLQNETHIQEIADRYRYMRESVALARGINQATAQETALKLIETCYVMCKAYSVADFMHGPFALIEPGFPCLLFAPDGATFPTALESASKLRSGGAETVIFASDAEILSLARTPVPMPVGIPEPLSPMVYAVAGQLFAYHLALTRDLNPDQPRGLQKVTKTR
ncbi:MAG: SIS domain-containing protein [Fimbriimonadales bacterium]|nr:SIS domain-containing protein [Fimbriimonadales bacterium]